MAAHDGSLGLRKTDGYEWLVRNDAAAQVGQGQTISAWVQFRTVADGRAYLGFGATPNDRGGPGPATSGALSTGRTLSLVLAANTQQLILQNNTGFTHPGVVGGSPAALATANLASPVLANTWYRLEVDWAVGGALTGRLFDSDGVSLLGTVSSPSQGAFAGQAGGIALRAFSPTRGEVYFDTVEVSGTTPFTSPFVGRTLIPAQTLNSTFNGAVSPFLYQSIPGTNLDVGLSIFNALAQIGPIPSPGSPFEGTVALAGLNESMVLGVRGVQIEQGWGPPINGLSGSGVPVETPLLQQYVFRWVPGQDTQLIGTSDVKHFFSSAHTDFQHLRPGEKDVYSQGLNSAPQLFSPHDAVDPVTGQLRSLDFLSALRTAGNGGPRNLDGINTNQTTPPGPTAHPTSPTLFTYQASAPRLLRVNIADLDPNQNPAGTRWFLAGHLWIVADQDVTNNTRWVEFIPVRNPATGNFTFTYPNGSAGQLDVRSIPGLANYARIIDDRNTAANPTFGAGFSATAGFTTVNNQGYGLGGPNPGPADHPTGVPNSVRRAAAGGGANSATWTFTGLQAGATYRISITYTTGAEDGVTRATNAPYSINGGAPILVDQQVAPGSFSYAGSDWRILTTGTLTGGSTIQVQLTDNANGAVVADGVLIERVTTPTTTEIADNAGPNFFATPGFFSLDGEGFGGSEHVANPGGGSEVAGWVFNNLTPGLYRISATWTEHPNRATNVPFYIWDGTPTANNLVGQATVNQENAPNHFSDGGAVWFNLGGPTSITTGMLVVALTDLADEFIIADAVRIERLAGDLTQIVDNTSGEGFVASPGFVQFSGQGFSDLGGVAIAAAGAGEEFAAWSFAVTPGGTYRVSISYTAGPARASDAPFFLFDGADFLGVVFVDQQQAPSDYTYLGSGWRDLGTFTLTSDTLTIVLLDLASGLVIADAIRIERVA